MGRQSVRALLVVIVTSFACPASAATKPSSEPADSSATTQTSREDRVADLFTYLTKEYSRELANKDWITRSVAVISLAQFPIDDATKAIVERLKRETHPVGKLVAWQAVLARAHLLSDAQFAAWQSATTRMIKDDLFQGDLRVALLEMMSAAPITSEQRRFVLQLFAKTNSLDSGDVPTLVAMGRAMRAWGDAQLFDGVVSALQNKDSATRAKLVLKAAGAELELDADSAAFEKWWKEQKPTFGRAKPQPGAWKNLTAQFIDPPVDAANVDPDDKLWKKQLELEALGLRDFDFAITIDCSRSMLGEIARLKRDLLVMYTALGEISQQARVGITGFAPGGETKTFLKLTARKDELLAGVKQLDVFGPLGEEEWAGGLETCIKANEWRPPHERSRRVIVLMTDEQMTPAQQEKATPIAKNAARDGFRIYAVLIFPLIDLPDPFKEAPTRGDDSASVVGPHVGRRGRIVPAARIEAAIDVYKDLVGITGGKATIVRVPQGALGLGAPTKWAGGTMRNQVSVSPSDIAPVYPNGGPTAHLLAVVLADAIHPQYAERIEPLVQILAAHSQRVAWVPEVRPK